MRRGYTLIEAIIASFLLVAAFLLVSRLFHAGLQYTSRVEKRALAAHLADKRMQEVRAWSKRHESWVGLPTGNDPAHPNFTIQVSLDPLELQSPSRQLELAHPAGDRRSMASAARQVTVEVTWDSERLRLTSLLADRFRGWRSANPIVVSGSIPPQVGPGDTVEFSARGFDAAGRAIEDLFFSWYVEPRQFPNAAVGTVEASRDGRTAEFRNQIQLLNGTVASRNGVCRVAVRAVYGGQERWGYSPDMQLVSP